MSDPTTPGGLSPEQLAEQTATRVTRETIERLQKVPPVTAGYEDPSLENFWEEVCVHQQGEEVADWEDYLDVIENTLELVVNKLKQEDLHVLWLRTPSGLEWQDEEESSRGAAAPYLDEIVEYLMEDHILPAAEEWTNPSVKKYLAHGIEEDDSEESD